MSCAGIFQDATVSCEGLVASVSQEVWLASLDDIDNIITGDPNVDPAQDQSNIVRELVMKTGTAFFKFSGVQQSINARTEKNATGLSVTYRHFVDVSVFEVDSIARRNLEAMAKRKLVAIVKQPNDTTVGDSGFTLFGLDAGLDVTVNTRNYSDQETGGAYRLELSTAASGGAEGGLPSTYQPGYLKINGALVGGVQQGTPLPGDQVSPVTDSDGDLYAAAQKCIDGILTDASYTQPNFTDDADGTEYQWDGVTPAPI